MTAVFADTFYWIALANPDDAGHLQAIGFDLERRGLPIVTTDEVLGEFLAHFAARGPFLRQKAVLIVRRILADRSIYVQHQTRATFLAGFELYAARPDKGYSLADCVSMLAMRNGKLLEALTNDRHFEQEGFRAVFRDNVA